MPLVSLLIALLFCAASVHAQVQPQITGSGAPTGSCTSTQQYLDTTNHVLYYCNNNTWSASQGLGNLTGLVIGASASPSMPMSGLMAWYKITPTENPCALVDYSGFGNPGNPATGCVGTAPTIIATTGGISCGGAGNVALPAALNAGKTFLWYGSKTTLPMATALEGLWSGDGGGATPAGTNIIALESDEIDTTTGRYSHLITTDRQGVGDETRTMGTFLGTGSIVLTYDTADRVWINGVETQYNIGQHNASGVQTVGAYHLCGNPAGSGFGSASFFIGNVYQFAVWNRVLSTAEIASAVNTVNSMEANLGVPVSSTNSMAGDLLFVNGDSTSCVAAGNSCGGSADTVAWPETIVLNGTWTIANRSRNSAQAIQLANLGPPGYSYWTNSGASGRLVEAIWLGTNDVCGGSATQAAVSAGLAQNVRNGIAQGATVVVGNMLSRTSCDTQKNTFDNDFRQNVVTYGPAGKVYTADLASIAALGANGASAVAAVFPDGIHPSNGSVYNLVTPLWQQAINAATGNHSYSSATTYSSAAAAATVPTALSESTNTMSFTAASWPAAQFKVGAQMFCTGQTPAGYAGTWRILTNSGTVVTAYNDTTGLGAGSVFGTCQAPLMQDADEYAILNFGAGNFNLEWAEGWCGRVIHINNINGAGSTLVPFGTETINGASTFSLAANTSVNLAGVGSSYTTGGCNWRTQ